MSATRGKTSTWWRHDANLSIDDRFSKLRSLLRADPYGLICRLYDFCASMQQDGDLSRVDDAVLADRLEFDGTGARLRKMLTKAGYIDDTRQVVGWEENLFKLFSSIREQNRERGLKSAAKRIHQKTQLDQTGEESTVAVERPVERSVESVASPAHSDWPISLSEQQITDLSSQTGKPPEFVVAMWPAYRDREIRYRANYFRPDALAGFRDQLRGAKNTTQAPPRTTLSEPEEWQLFLRHNHAGEGWAEGAAACAWSSLPPEWQAKIRSKMGLT